MQLETPHTALVTNLVISVTDLDPLVNSQSILQRNSVEASEMSFPEHGTLSPHVNTNLKIKHTLF